MTTPTTDWTRRWQELEGEHWVREAERYDTMVGEFGDAMLDAADLKQGERVLDVGCGNGATTIEAADGFVLAVSRSGSISRTDAWAFASNVRRLRARRRPSSSGMTRKCMRSRPASSTRW